MRVTERGGVQSYFDLDDERENALHVDTSTTTWTTNLNEESVLFRVMHDWEGEENVVGYVALRKQDVFGLIGQLLEWASRQ